MLIFINLYDVCMHWVYQNLIYWYQLKNLYQALFGDSTFYQFNKEKIDTLTAKNIYTKDLYLSSPLYCCFYSPNYCIISLFYLFFHLFCYQTLISKEIQKSLTYSCCFSLVYLLKWKTPLDPGDKNLSSLIKCGKMKRNLYRSFQRNIWKDKMKLLGEKKPKMTCHIICLQPPITKSMSSAPLPELNLQQK